MKLTLVLTTKSEQPRDKIWENTSKMAAVKTHTGHTEKKTGYNSGQRAWFICPI